ncbi:polysaccharide deacetylase family protein [Streptococcus sp. zg-JUN1979]|uniref:polysaccharide deacetylase family protein n=1 Tax=Streptococcus sp. zg-JUN1979 TaxID=3391450 RepID=UPI0039A5D9EC
MGKKYFTVSYDDGLVQDEQIISLMRRYGIKGTFNLNSALFGERRYIKHIGNLGYKVVDKASWDTVSCHVISEQKALEIYKGDDIEIASHGSHHLKESTLIASQLQTEIVADKERLTRLFGQEVTGHIFPYGDYSADTIAFMKKAGLRYGRAVRMLKKPKDFQFHHDRGIMIPTCWQLDYFAESLLQDFIDLKETDDDQVFLMWGHGYELDFGTRKGNWQRLEKLFQMVARAGDIICVTNAQLAKRLL